jgi:hypothetical protein
MNALLFSMTSVVIVAILLVIFEKVIFEKMKDTISNDVISNFLNFIGVLFTLILAFVVVAAWEDYDNAMHTAQDEAHKLLYIHEDAADLSPANKKIFQAKLEDYTNSIIKDEWDFMDENHKIKVTEEKFHELVTLKKTFVVNGDQDVIAEVDQGLDDLKVLRHARESYTESHVPRLLWFVLFGGSAICILLCFCINFDKLVWKIIMVSLVTFTMSVVLYLTYSLSNPYKGDMKITSEHYIKALQMMMKNNNE